jgi:nucleoside-diphosphate-sugar epimerase
MARVAILGAAGAVGLATAAELERRRIPYRVTGRDAGKLKAAFGDRAEIATANLEDSDQTARALEGIETAIYTAGQPYPQHSKHPAVFRSAVEAAQRAGVARMALVSSVYAYGLPQTPRVAETHPREPNTRKGVYRKQQEDVAFAADGQRGLRTLVLRLPDFYGPNAVLSHAHQIFEGALKGGAANWIGPPDLPREFVFVPDAAPVLLDLIAREDSFGEAWNFAGPGTITGNELAAAVYQLAGRQPTLRVAGKGLLRIAGLFNADLREMVEMYYLSTNPVILDDSKLDRHLGTLRKTPYAEGIRQSWDWYKARGAR